MKALPDCPVQATAAGWCLSIRPSIFSLIFPYLSGISSTTTVNPLNALPSRGLQAKMEGLTSLPPKGSKPVNRIFSDLIEASAPHSPPRLINERKKLYSERGCELEERSIIVLNSFMPVPKREQHMCWQSNYRSYDNKFAEVRRSNLEFNRKNADDLVDDLASLDIQLIREIS
jgi:hypothetical protein